MKNLVSVIVVTALAASQAQAAMRITEWMYNGSGEGNFGEFVELTNIGAASIDMTGWSFDDDSRTAGTTSLSGFGVVAPGESVVLTDYPAADFRTVWGLSALVKVVGDNAANLGRNDEVNIFDGGGNLVDRLTYGDVNIAGTIRTNAVSGNPMTPAALGANNVAQWQLSVVGDAFGSIANTVGDIGNPGSYAIPEPTTIALAMFAVGLGLCGRRRAH